MLLSLSIWGKLLGILGLMLAIPFTCLAIAWYQRWMCQETHFGLPMTEDDDNEFCAILDEAEETHSIVSDEPYDDPDSSP